MQIVKCRKVENSLIHNVKMPKKQAKNKKIQDKTAKSIKNRMLKGEYKAKRDRGSDPRQTGPGSGTRTDGTWEWDWDREDWVGTRTDGTRDGTGTVEAG